MAEHVERDSTHPFINISQQTGYLAGKLAQLMAPFVIINFNCNPLIILIICMLWCGMKY